MLSDEGNLHPGQIANDIVVGQRRRLARHLGRMPTDVELFDHLTTWSNGYTAGREL